VATLNERVLQDLRGISAVSVDVRSTLGHRLVCSAATPPRNLLPTPPCPSPPPIVDATGAQDYKFMVTCVVMQRTGAGLTADASAYWDPSTDGSVTAVWESKALTCIVTIFATLI
jgi:hypothetical protein